TTPRKFRIPVTAGPHTLGVAIVDRQRGAGVDEIYFDFRVDGTIRPPGAIQNVVITGPFNASGVGDTPSRRRLFVCQPQSAATETACASKILSTVARRAYRGPVSDAELSMLMSFYQQGRKSGDFETGIQQALARVLVATRFTFRAGDEAENL